MRKFDYFALIGSVLLILSFFLPFWGGVSLIGGAYDMWVGAPALKPYGMSQSGPGVIVDAGWATWVDVMMLTVGIGLIFSAAIIGIFKSMIGALFGIIGILMISLGFIGFPQITYFWVWTLMGPAVFLQCVGTILLLFVSRRSRIRSVLTEGKKALVLPLVVIVLSLLFIVSAHSQAAGIDNEIRYYDENLNIFLPSTIDTNTRKTFLTSFDGFVQKCYLELPKFVEYSSVYGHGLGWGDNFQSWSLIRLLRLRVQHILSEINETRVESGAVIWRVYNEGFIVRTQNLTIGFDVACTWLCPEIAELADYVDLLFVSHSHGDHADVEVLERAAQRGVKIVVPEPDVENNAWYITQLPQNAQVVPLLVEQPYNISGVRVRAFLGPHSDVNYAYLVELPDGLRLLHMGDTEYFSVLTWNPDNTQIVNSTNLTWVDNLADEKQIDIAFIHVSALTNIPQEAIKIPIIVHQNTKVPLGRPFSETALKPKIIVPMHENEVGHGLAWFSSFNLRLAYQQSNELNSEKTQVVVVTWGQKMVLEK